MRLPRLKRITPLLVFILLVAFLLKTDWHTRDRVYQIQYDWTHKNREVIYKKEIDIIFEQLESISFQQLDTEYLQHTKSNNTTYKPLLKDLTYYKIKREDLNKKIVGEFRLKQFLARDKYFAACILNNRPYIVAPLNIQLFYKILELQNELDKQGYNPYAFGIVNGHRPPRYNERIKGAKLSRHIKGEAVDISIYDIDENGSSNSQDKDIVLDILDKVIIQDKGGIGLYPGSQSVHFDVRGTKARWNSF